MPPRLLRNPARGSGKQPRKGASLIPPTGQGSLGPARPLLPRLPRASPEGCSETDVRRPVPSGDAARRRLAAGRGIPGGRPDAPQGQRQNGRRGKGERAAGGHLAGLGAREETQCPLLCKLGTRGPRLGGCLLRRALGEAARPTHSTQGSGFARPTPRPVPPP